MNSSKSPSGTFGLCSVLPQAFKTCLGHSEHHSEACLAIHHSFVCFLGFCKRQRFDDWTDIWEYAGIKRVLSLGSCSGETANNCPPAKDQGYAVDWDGITWAPDNRKFAPSFKAGK